MKRWLLLVVLAACGGDDRRGACERMRDQAVARQQESTRVAAESVRDPADRASLERDAAAEIRQFESRFVDVCVAADAPTFACMRAGAADPEAKPTPDCKPKLEATTEQIYR